MPRFLPLLFLASLMTVAPARAEQLSTSFRRLSVSDQKLVFQLADLTLKALPQANRDDAVDVWTGRLERLRAPYSLFMQKEMNDHLIMNFFDVRSGRNAIDPDGFQRAAMRIMREERGGVSAGDSLNNSEWAALVARGNQLFAARGRAYNDLESGGKTAAAFLRQGLLVKRIFFTNQLKAEGGRLQEFAGALKALRGRLGSGAHFPLQKDLMDLERRIQEFRQRIQSGIREVQGVLSARRDEMKKLGLVPIEYSPLFKEYDVEIRLPAGGTRIEIRDINGELWNMKPLDSDCPDKILRPN